MAIKFFAFFFPTISTFGCFWSQWPTSLAVTSGCPTMRCGRLPSRSDVNIRNTVFIKMIKHSKYIKIPSYMHTSPRNLKKTQCHITNKLLRLESRERLRWPQNYNSPDSKPRPRPTFKAFSARRESPWALLYKSPACATSISCLSISWPKII